MMRVDEIERDILFLFKDRTELKKGGGSFLQVREPIFICISKLSCGKKFLLT